MRTITGIQFDAEDVALFKQALPHGYDNALGLDEKERPKVRSVRYRLTELERSRLDDPENEPRYTRPFFATELAEIFGVIQELADYFLPQMNVEFWRKGLPEFMVFSENDQALDGLAKERQYAVRKLGEVMELLGEARSTLTGIAV
jgi:hypothetical protein